MKRTTTEKVLEGKRVLFFGLETFGYEKEILKEMREKGCIADYFNGRPVVSQLGKAIIKFAPWFLNIKSKKYFSKIIESVKDKSYDIIFFIKCDGITIESLELIRKTFPRTEMRLHMWDSIRNIKGMNEKINIFDKVTSFDRKDCLEHPSFGFRPLFYTQNYQMKASDKQVFLYDVSFCGTIHSDRYDVLEKVRSLCDQKGLKEFDYPYLQSKFVFWIYKIADKRYRKLKTSDFCYTPLPTEKAQDLMYKTRAMLDIHHPNQSGLTMRAIECLGARRKLITTNKDIKNYDFFRANNIMVIDRENPIISEEFLSTDYELLQDEIYKKYSISQWVSDVLTM